MTEVIKDVNALRKALDAVVDQLVAISGYEEEINTICENAQEKTGLKAADIKKRGKLAFKYQYQRDKFDKEREQAESIYDEVEGVMGK